MRCGDADDHRRVPDPDAAHPVNEEDASRPEPSKGLSLEVAEAGENHCPVRFVIEGRRPAAARGFPPDPADEEHDRSAGRVA